MNYQVRAKPWKHGWELHIDGVGVTQSRTLAGAEQMVRDYIATLTDSDPGDADVVISPDLDGMESQAAEVRAKVARVQRENVEAAKESREVARALRSSGLSVTDTAILLGVSRGRVSQLTRG
ncbi:MAG TPA: antitoxin HicB [Nocardioidaceae bacterium]|nr:antitoxin HicB [Nocardioidaceae bacterium]